MSVSKIITRASNRGLEAKAGTSIFLLHNGQPRTPFYAKQHLEKVWTNCGFPRFVTSKMADAYWYGSQSMRKCISACENNKSIEEVLGEYAPQLEKSLSTVIPEFRPISVRSAFLFDSPSIETRIREGISIGTDSMILVSLYPFEITHLTSPMFKAANSVINTVTRPLDRFGADPNVRIGVNSPVSFRLLTLDNIGRHSSIIHYWSERLQSKLDDFDSVIFTLPLPERGRGEYVAAVNETTKKIMYNLYENYPRAVPWRIAFYSPWYQFWPPLSTQTISSQVKDLRKNGRTRTLAVPLAELFPNFDTQVVLPELVRKEEHVELLAPGYHDQALVNSFVEVIKTSLLERTDQERKVPRVKTQGTFNEALA